MLYINHAVKRPVEKLSVDDIKYSIDLITKIIKNENFCYDRQLFLNRLLELQETYNGRLRLQHK